MKKNHKTLLGVTLLLFGLSHNGNAQTTQTFSFSGASQTFTVPPCVSSITLDVRGAAGANAIDKLTTNSTGGLGGRVQAVLTVTPGQVYTLFVGGQGSTNGTTAFNGGGSGGLSIAGNGCFGGNAGGGGGASDIRFGGTGLADRIIVAGGGGGSGRDYCNGSCIPCGCGGSGGNGGGLLGVNGFPANNCGFSYPGSGLNFGGGATGLAGGLLGPGDSGGPNGSAGVLGNGGVGATGNQDVSGGGGGGGYYGGGGGGSAVFGSGVGGGGGGGGSSYVAPSNFSNITHTSGFQSNNGSIVISYNLSNLVTATQNNTLICSAGTLTSSTLFASSVSNYTWNTGSNSPSITVTPTATTIYTVTGTNSLGCVSTATLQVQMSNLNATVSVVNPLCFGSNGTVSVNASGGVSSYSYTWSNGLISSSFTTATLGAYTATVSDNTCSITKMATLISPSAISITIVPSNILGTCLGQSSTLTASAGGGTGGYTYTWVAGPNTNTFVVTPTIATIYTVNCLDANNCAKSQTINMLVNPSPTITVNSGTICAGTSFTISPSGANTYTIQGGNAIVSPSTTSNFTVIGISTQGCLGNTVSSNITVNATPTILTNSGAICVGASFTINPSGGNTYTIQGGNAVVTPSSTTSYTVNGTNTLGCTGNVAISNVTVNALPALSASVSSNSVCANGSTIALTGSPSGGVFTGTNVTGSIFTPDNNVGNFTQTYAFTNSVTSCSNTTSTSIAVLNCTGVNSKSLNSLGIEVYPNPTNGELTIKLKSKDSNTSILILNSLGQTVLSEKATYETLTIDLSKINNGIYFLQVINDNKILSTQKIVKQ